MVYQSSKCLGRKQQMKNHNIAINVKIELGARYPYSIVEEGHVKECQSVHCS